MKYLTIEQLDSMLETYETLPDEDKEIFNKSLDFLMEKRNIETRELQDEGRQFAEVANREKGDIRTALPSERLQLKISEATAKASFGDADAQEKLKSLKNMQDAFYSDYKVNVPKGEGTEEKLMELTITDKHALALRNGYTTAGNMMSHYPKMLMVVAGVMSEKERKAAMKLEAQNMITPQSDFENPVLKTLANSWYQITSMAPPLVTSYIAATAATFGAAAFGFSEAASGMAGTATSGFFWGGTSAESLHGEMLASGMEDNSSTMIAAELGGMVVGATEALQLDMFTESSKKIIEKISMDALKENLKKEIIIRGIKYKAKEFAISGAKETGMEIFQTIVEMTTKLIADDLGETEITNLGAQWEDFKDQAIPTAVTMYMMQALGIPMAKARMMMGGASTKQEIKELQEAIDFVDEVKVQVLDLAKRDALLAEQIAPKERTENQQSAIDKVEKHIKDGKLDEQSLFNELEKDIVDKASGVKKEIPQSVEEKEMQVMIDEIQQEIDTLDPEVAKDLDPEDIVQERDPGWSGLYNENIEILREQADLSKLPEKDKKSFDDAIKSALLEDTAKTAIELATDIINNPRQITPAEHVGLVIKTNELLSQKEKLLEKISDMEMSGNMDLMENYENEIKSINNRIDLITQASDKTGSLASEALNIRRIIMNREDFSFKAMSARAKQKKQADLTIAEEQNIKAKDTEFKALREEISTAEEQAKMAQEQANSQTETDVQKWIDSEPTVRITAEKQKRLDKKKQELFKRFEKLGYRLNSVEGVTFEVANMVKDLARIYVQQGINKAEQVMNQIKTDIPGLKEREIWDSLGGKIKNTRKKVASQTQKTLKNIQTQAKILTDILDRLDGKTKPPTSKTPTSKEVKELSRKMGILKTEAYKTIFNDAKLKRYIQTLEKLQDMYNRDYRNLKEEKKNNDTTEIKNTKQAIELKKKEIAALDKKIFAKAELDGDPKLDTKNKTKENVSKELSQLRDNIKDISVLKNTRDRVAKLQERLDTGESPEIIRKESRAISEDLQKELDKESFLKKSLLEPNKIAKLKQKLKELNAGIDNKAKRKEDSDEVIELKKKISDKRKELRSLENKQSSKKEKRVLTDEEKKLISDAKKILNAENRIADLQNQINTGEYKTSPDKKLAIVNEDLQKLYIKERQLKRAIRNEINQMAPTWKKVLSEVFTMPKTLKATADMSYTLRQGMLLSVMRPGLASKVFVEAGKAFANENTADSIALAMEKDPHFTKAMRHGLKLTALGGDLGLNEELFNSNFAERIPIYGALVRASERHMVTGLNLLRFSVFKEMAERPDISDKALDAWAHYVNVATGHGDVEMFGNTLKIANAVIFSPKFVISRLQAPIIMSYYAMKYPELRTALAKDMVGTVSIGMLALVLASAAGATVGALDDPESSDWGKIVIGKTRIDLFAGFIQPARLVALIMKAAAAKVGLTELNENIDILDSSSRFAQYKLSPLITFPLEIIRGKDIVGREREFLPSDLSAESIMESTLVRAATPLIADSIYDLITIEDDALKTSAFGLLGILGGGVSTYEKRKKKKKGPLL